MSAEAIPFPAESAAPPESPVTDEMIACMAKRLWEVRGGNSVLNWIEAESALQDLVRRAPEYPSAPLSNVAASKRARAIATRINTASS